MLGNDHSKGRDYARCCGSGVACEVVCDMMFRTTVLLSPAHSCLCFCSYKQCRPKRKQKAVNFGVL